MAIERPRRRALLVASIGVATVSYALAGCGKSAPPGNLAQPPAPTVTPVAGNLTAPPPASETPLPVATPSQEPPTSGNLMPPPPRDAGSAHDAGSAKPPAKPPKLPPTSGNLMAPR